MAQMYNTIHVPLAVFQDTMNSITMLLCTKFQNVATVSGINIPQKANANTQSKQATEHLAIEQTIPKSQDSHNFWNQSPIAPP